MAARQPPTPESIRPCALLSMPNEILRDIADFVTTEPGHKDYGGHVASHDILAFRLVCKNFSAIGLKSLLAKVSRLYIQRSTCSLQFFDDLSSPPEFSCAVHEVAVLANQILKRWTYRNKFTSLVADMGLNAAKRREDARLEYRERYQQQENIPAPAFHSTLLQGLLKLPNVRKATFLDCIDSQGFNVEERFSSSAYSPIEKSDSNFTSHYYKLWEMGGRSSPYDFFENNSQKLLDGMMAAIASKNGSITSLQLGSEIGLGVGGSPIHHDYVLQMDVNPSSRLAFSQLVSLKIVHFHNEENARHTLPDVSRWQALLSCATALRNLWLWAFDSAAALAVDATDLPHYFLHGPRGRNLFSGLLSSTHVLPSLEHLSLKDDNRRPPTEFCLENLLHFLRRHKSTIKKVTLCGLFPNECYHILTNFGAPPEDQTILQAMVGAEVSVWLKLLFFLRDEMTLEAAHVQYLQRIFYLTGQEISRVCGFLPGRAPECTGALNWGLFALRSEEETEALRREVKRKIAEGWLCEHEERCMEEHMVGYEEHDLEVGSEDDDWAEVA